MSLRSSVKTELKTHVKSLPKTMDIKIVFPSKKYSEKGQYSWVRELKIQLENGFKKFTRFRYLPRIHWGLTWRGVRFSSTGLDIRCVEGREETIRTSFARVFLKCSKSKISENSLMKQKNRWKSQSYYRRKPHTNRYAHHITLGLDEKENSIQLENMLIYQDKPIAE